MTLFVNIASQCKVNITEIVKDQMDLRNIFQNGLGGQKKYVAINAALKVQYAFHFYFLLIAPNKDVGIQLSVHCVTIGRMLI